MPKTASLSRLICDLTGEKSGPLLVLMAGIHGNEPAGIRAVERVAEALQGSTSSLRGRIVGLRGNLKALSLGERFIHRDLNRLWTAASIEHVKSLPPQRLDVEQGELSELLEQLRGLDHSHPGPKVMIDLHTTSAPGGKFSVVEEDALSIDLALALQAPVIRGLTKALLGTTTSYCVEQGWSGLAFEAGQHHDPRAIDEHEAAIWVILKHLGLIEDQVSWDSRAQQALHHLREDSLGLPRQVAVRYRHVIHTSDKFRMRPGYINFQPVHQGEWLADDQAGRILAPTKGLILMPLYQPQGADGFFIIQPLSEGKTLIG
ncbi:MAG: succinylglutamate desuccinylase/aspartoacylase family protein [Bacteroidota bacterium]